MSDTFNTQIQSHEITVSPSALEQMKKIIAGAEDGVEGIRIFVTGGGCGGMTYGMTYAESVTPFDKVLDDGGVKVMVDAVALNYLKGCDIDYVEQGLNASFVFNNVFKSVGGSGGCSACGSSGGGCA